MRDEQRRGESIIGEEAHAEIVVSDEGQRKSGAHSEKISVPDRSFTKLKTACMVISGEQFGSDLPLAGQRERVVCTQIATD